VRPEYYGNPAGVTEDVDVVRAIYAAFAARDLEAGLAHVAPDCEIVVEGTARRAGRSGPYRGTRACATTSPTSSAHGTT